MSELAEPATAQTFSVTVKVEIEYSATIEIRARDQAEAERIALAEYESFAASDDYRGYVLGFPEPWNEHDVWIHDPEIDTRFHCVDCGKCTSSSGECYMVADALWAAAGMEPHGGMLCLIDFERRIGRKLTLGDFTAMVPDTKAWRRHLAARRTVPEQLDLLAADVLNAPPDPPPVSP